jgi:hypothetical protein
MQILMIILRLLHVVSGVFWAGGAFFLLRIIMPTVQEAGPEGGRFMQRMAASGRLSQAFAIASVLTTLSGVIMFWYTSGNLNPAWIVSGPGIVLTIGALAGLGAFGHGFFATRKVTDQVGALAKEMLAQQGPPDPAKLQQAQALGARMGALATQSAILLAVAVLGMATFRYFGF